MCTAYWSLNVRVTCPACGTEADDSLQTHFMGEFMSCDKFYELGEPVAELAGFSGIVKPPLDDFIGGNCETDGCRADYVIYGFEVADGRVMKVWPVRYWAQRKSAEALDVPPDEQERLAVRANRENVNVNVSALTWLKVAVKDLEALGARIEEGQVTPASIDMARISTDRALAAIEER